MKRSTVLILILIGLITFNLVRTVIPHFHEYSRSDYWERYPSLKKMYYDSVYANKDGDFISDQYVYSFAAGSLIKGVSPILVNPEMPPLGKYFIAISILLFNNEHLVTLVFGIGSLLMLYLVGRQVFVSNLMALLTPLLLSFEPLFLNQLIVSPLLDIMQLFFLLAFFYFFNQAEIKKKYTRYYLLANCMLGAFISVKFFGTGVTLVGAAVLILVLKKQLHNVVKYALTSLVAPVILLFMYIQVLFSGYSFSAFLGIQKWILLYNQGHLSKYFTFFPLFLFNIWYSWWDESVMSDPQWQFTWPLSFVTFIIVVGLYLRNKKYRNPALNIVLAWTGLYILLLQTGYMSARYFVILLPPIFLIMIYCFKTLSVMYLKGKK